MLMHSQRLAIVYGGIGAITPTDGVAILIMEMVGTTGMVLAGASVGAAGTAVAGMDGDTIITTIIIPAVAGILVVDTGEAVVTGAIPIRTVAQYQEMVMVGLQQYVEAEHRQLPVAVQDLLFVQDLQHIEEVNKMELVLQDVWLVHDQLKVVPE